MRHSIVLLVTALIAVTGIASAQTVIPGGMVSGSWVEAGSPYLVEGEITIPADSSLNIGPSVEVVFQGYFGLTVNGVLEAVGAEMDSIHFSAADTVSGWKGIDFDDAPVNSHMDYCSVRDAKASGIHCTNSSPIISRCTVTHNSASIGGGLRIAGASAPSLSYCTVTHNSAPWGWGGGVHISSSQSPVLSDCIIELNSSFDDGGGMFIGGSGTTNVLDCVIDGNSSSDYGGGVYCISPAVFSGCIVSQNVAESWGGGVCCAGDAGPTFADCTFEGNSCIFGAAASVTGYPEFSYCSFRQNDDSHGAIYLSSGTAMIDHCTFVDNNSAQAGALWIEGGTAFVANTIFAYTGDSAIYNGSGLSVRYSDFFANAADVSGGVPIAFGDLARVNGNGDSCDVYYNIFLQPKMVDPTLGDFRLLGISPCIDAGDTAFAPDPDGTVTDIGRFYFDQTEGTIHVPGDAATIQGGIDMASAGDTVVVACGTYYEHVINLRDSVYLRSETGEADCVTIDAEQKGRVLYASGLGSQSRVEGFTLTGGYASGTGTARHGGGMACLDGSSPTLVKVDFTDNQAQTDGGGLYCRDASSPILEDCRFIGNEAASSGGGICCWNGSAPAIVGGTVTGNHATAGGGLRCYASSPSFTGTTISGNLAWGGGGIQCAESSMPTMVNSLVWGNCAQDEGNEVKLGDAGSSIAFTCCDVDTTGFAGPGSVFWLSGSISIDPMFCDQEPCESAPTIAGDYHLKSGSPVLDAPGCGLIGGLGEGCEGVSVAEPGYRPSHGLELEIARPNPFNPATEVHYTVPAGDPSRVTITVYDSRGRRVKTILDRVQGPGAYQVKWDGRNASGRSVVSGVYFCRLDWNEQCRTMRLVLAR